MLAKQHELQQLQRELRRKEAELLDVQLISERWIATLQASVAEARDLGFLPSIDPSHMSRGEMLEALKGVAALKRPERSVTAADIQESGDELRRLSSEEATVSQELSTLGRRLAEMQQLRESIGSFRDALALQRDHLQVSQWLMEHRADAHDCPICGNNLAEVSPRLEELLRSLDATERSVKQIGDVPPSFDREMERVRAAVSQGVERLRGIRIRQTALARRSDEARAEHYGILNASRFLGRLEADLKTLESIGQDGELRSEVDALREQVNALLRIVSSAGIEERMRRAVNTVNLNAGRLMPHLDAERPNSPISLSERELTIKVQGNNRDDYLWEIGSGSNWLSYHVAVSLALQQFFLTVRNCAVPNFIVYDQPSQVYFPRRLAARDSDEVEETPLRDQDVAAVRRILTAIAMVVEASDRKLQVIVLDHASESVWGSVPGVHSVEDWRDGRALVPHAWTVRT
jgi:hypothetical protein